MDESWRQLVLSATGENALHAEVVPHGANNRLFRIDCLSSQSYALKQYPQLEGDNRDRLITETSCLEFLAPRCVGFVPKVFGYDEVAQIALYQWIEGDLIEKSKPGDIGEVLTFIKRLKEVSGEVAKSQFFQASEACVSFSELVRQIENRYTKLLNVSGKEPELALFLKKNFLPLFQSFPRESSVCDVKTEHLCLSPSDFGFHNAIRCDTNRLVFVDFEYFGWDDPVKLVCDFLLHPAMNLTERESSQFLAGAKNVFSNDPNFYQRFCLLYPFFALRWCLILLNEFLPECWKRRQIAGVSEKIEKIKSIQLQKAKAWYFKSEGFKEILTK